MGEYEIEVIVPKDLEDLIPSFLANRQRELALLTSALVASDLVRLRQLGHRMKGVGCAYGFAPITALGERVEHFVSACDLTSVAECVAQYGDFLSKLRVKFK
jgi:HPt (histidine-containing phosphotransfer) domain-containing protein